jgi:hypothetical protein
MTREWVQEASDRRLALNVEENLKAEEKEEKEVMNRNTKAGEAAALNAALEERRGQKQRAEAKKQQEAADAEAAKRSILDDIDQHYEQVLNPLDPPTLLFRMHSQPNNPPMGLI